MFDGRLPRREHQWRLPLLTREDQHPIMVSPRGAGGHRGRSVDLLPQDHATVVGAESDGERWDATWLLGSEQGAPRRVKHVSPSLATRASFERHSERQQKSRLYEQMPSLRRDASPPPRLPLLKSAVQAATVTNAGVGAGGTSADDDAAPVSARSAPGGKPSKTRKLSSRPVVQQNADMKSALERLVARISRDADKGGRSLGPDAASWLRSEASKLLQQANKLQPLSSLSPEEQAAAVAAERDAAAAAGAGGSNVVAGGGVGVGSTLLSQPARTQQIAEPEPPPVAAIDPPSQQTIDQLITNLQGTLAVGRLAQ